VEVEAQDHQIILHQMVWLVAQEAEVEEQGQILAVAVQVILPLQLQLKEMTEEMAVMMEEL
tara:strand:+ start:411 stop:593 length:183 start_codon:yes stop_codon:yes gene_type:complete